MPAGRPPFEWTDEMVEEIFTRMMNGETIGSICGVGRDDWLPSEVTFYKRLANDEEFAKEYVRAREVQAHREVDEIRKIADEALPENVHVARLQIDARKWRASKMASKKYGDKLEVDNKSSDGSMSPKAIPADIAAALAAKLVE